MIVSNGNSTGRRKQLGVSNQPDSTTTVTHTKPYSRRFVNASSSSLSLTSAAVSTNGTNSKSSSPAYSTTSSSTSSSLVKKKQMAKSSGKNLNKKLNDHLKLRKATSTSKSSVEKQHHPSGDSSSSSSTGKKSKALRSLNEQLLKSSTVSNGGTYTLSKRRYMAQAIVETNEDMDEMSLLKQEPVQEDDLNSTTNVWCVINTPDVANLTEEEFRKQDDIFEQKLVELRERFDLVRRLSTSGDVKSVLESVQEGANGVFLSDFIAELNKLDSEANGNMNVIKYWLEKETNEVEEQFRTEYKRAIQEYQDKRKELKESLKNEHDEMRKQIEVDRNTLDINIDITEPKPVPTRKLRRRFNANQFVQQSPFVDFSSMDSSNHLDSSSLVANVTPSVLQNGLVTGSVVNHPGSLNVNATLQYPNAAALTNSTYYSQIQGYYSSIGTAAGSSTGVVCTGTSAASALSANLNFLNVAGLLQNDRKRKLGPITFAISEDEINEDHKCLLKNLSTPSRFNASPRVQLASGD